MKRVTAVTSLLLLLMIFASCSKQNMKPITDLPAAPELKKINVSDSAVAAISLPGFPDFLIADEAAVWVTNVDHLSKLVLSSDTPVANVDMPVPCGAGAAAFGSLWVASCADQSLYRIDKNAAMVTSIIHTGLADPFGELSI